MADLQRYRRDASPAPDPTAQAVGTPGLLPPVPNAAEALLPLDAATWARMEHDYLHGQEKGQTTHVPQIDKHFTWMPGYTNVITGWPGHGKTELYLQLLLYRAVFDDKKSAIFSPENGSPEDVYNGLIHTLTSKNPDQDWQRHLGLADYARAKDFIREHFVVVSPRRGMGKTPAHLLAYFEAAIARFGVSHCLLDPWNKADHSAQVKLGGIEAYLIHVLGLCTDWSAATRQCLVITAHPKRLEDMAFGKSRQVPDGASISGGQTWENMAHVVGSVHRPFKHLEGNTDVELYWHKVKSHKRVGHPGALGVTRPGEASPETRVTFDWQTNRYYFNGWSPLEHPIAYASYGAQWPGTGPGTSAPAPAQLMPPPLPPLTTPSNFDTVPTDMLPGGARPIRFSH